MRKSWELRLISAILNTASGSASHRSVPNGRPLGSVQLSATPGEQLSYLE